MEGPFGSFFLREDTDKPMILLASGTGFAPIKAIIEQLKHTGSQRKAHLYWGCRSKADLYLNDWAERAAHELPHLKYIPVLSEAKPEDAWTGRTGLVHHAVMHDHPNLMEWQSTRAVHRSWWSRRSTTSSSSAGCPTTSSMPTPSPRRRTSMAPERPACGDRQGTQCLPGTTNTGA